MESPRALVQSFFDKLAPTYRRRYEGKQAFLKYLHSSRVEKALEGWSPYGKTILDIGAGTGILFDCLPPGQDYYACDISPAMLEHSAIPESRRRVGAPWECDFPVSSFDAMFALGVTTYLNRRELDCLMDYISCRLSKGGRAVVSFTNRSSIDFKFRKCVALLLPKGMMRSKALGQAFAPMACTVEEIAEWKPSALRLERLIWLNAAVFPLNRLFPRFSTWLSRRLLERRLPVWLARRLCADFMLVLTLQ